MSTAAKCLILILADGLRQDVPHAFARKQAQSGLFLGEFRHLRWRGARSVYRAP